MSGHSSYACPRCGARRYFRSHPRSSLESLARAWTPFRVYRCHACGLRAWSFGKPPEARTEDQKALGLPGRPLERRDSEWFRRRRRNLVLTAIAAALVGAAFARWFVLD